MMLKVKWLLHGQPCFIFELRTCSFISMTTLFAAVWLVATQISHLISWSSLQTLICSAVLRCSPFCLLWNACVCFSYYHQTSVLMQLALF